MCFSQKKAVLVLLEPKADANLARLAFVPPLHQEGAK